MQIIQDTIQNLQQWDDFKNSVVVIGYFDGVHKYHQQILNQAKNLALKKNQPFVFITFDQKISAFLQKTSQDLISPATKQALIAQYQPSAYLELKVNQALTNYHSLDFIHWLKNVIQADILVVGEDFRFGSKAMGDVKLLIEHFSKEKVIVFKRHNKISSGKLRQLVLDGEIKKVNKDLKRRLEIEFVIKNKQVKIKYPELNLPNGIYEIINDQDEIKELIIEEQKLILENLNSRELITKKWQIICQK
ncbi:hypothetical protein [Williamsoniiplasma lucivorax]|uniref:FAD synthase n=1 Tax=Williamsoniiplasma lucivorax TaxID=209274 RepID=A0A2S5RE60_9MOLU|nr:hypothetical protein [Williamsoniiplasma lucivorax]PPE05502.1 bifunctional riboflavin kinase/FMN adenylyltransferase [Williamsoniiplasma lucivorax]